MCVNIYIERERENEREGGDREGGGRERVNDGVARESERERERHSPCDHRAGSHGRASSYVFRPFCA